MNGMYEHLLRQGVEAHNAGDFNKARGIYGAILTQDPSHPDASHNLGVLEISSNNMPDALPLLKRASDSRPDVAKFWFTYIDVLISVKDFKTAKRALKKVKNKGLFDESFKVLAKKLTKPSQTTLNAELEKLPVQADVEELMLQYANGHYDLACEQALSIIKNWPNHCLSWKILSSIYAQTAKLDEAFWAIQNAIKVDPDDVETHNISANILNDMGKHRDAEICCRTALSLDASLVEAHNALGISLFGQHRYEEAVESYMRAVSISPDYAQAHFNLGIVNCKLGRHFESEANYLAAIEHNASFPAALYNLGNLLSDLGRMGEAEIYYQNALDLSPEFTGAHYSLANILYKMGRSAEAITGYNRVISLSPDYFEAYCNLGAIFQDQKKYEEAESIYAAGIESCPEQLILHINLGKLLYTISRFEDSIGVLTRASVFSPEDPELLNELGLSLQKIDRFEEAEDCFRRAILFDADSFDATFNLASIHIKLGRTDEAKGCLKKLLELNPLDEAVKFLLASIDQLPINTAPNVYISALFDDFAPSFDTHLVENLGYQTPRIISDIILADVDDGSVGSVLDLGCGTGLFGGEIRNSCVYLEGVDLSVKMLEEAADKNIYDKLKLQEVGEYLAIASLDFDYFIASDVFVYVGELSAIFELIKTRNNRPGRLVFSTEHSDGDGFYLQKSGRFSHSKNYIDTLCEKYDYKVLNFSTVDIRSDGGIMVPGAVYLLAF